MKVRSGNGASGKAGGGGGVNARRPRLGPGGRGASNGNSYRSSAISSVLHSGESAGRTETLTGSSTSPPQICCPPAATEPSTSTLWPSDGGLKSAETSV